MTLASQPFFTVVMATYNRSRHILPSIQSVLYQDRPDFELLVIGDKVTDDTAQVVAACGDDRVRWINLADRWQSQSGPNNRGNAEARGEKIAYIGHDDVWAPDHLGALARTYADTGADVVFSGLLRHPSNPAEPRGLMGIGTSAELIRHFTPPSAMSHGRGILQQVGPWCRREEAVAPVDADLQIRIARHGLRVASTGRITVHKYTSAARYLSYLAPTSDDQAALVELFRTMTPVAREAWRARIGAHAVSAGISLQDAQSGATPQQRAARADLTRGLSLPPLIPLGAGVTIRQTSETRAGHWFRPKKGDLRWRWSRPGVDPLILLPVSGGRHAQLEIELRWPDARQPQTLVAEIDGAAVVLRLMRQNGLFARGTFLGEADIALKPDGYSVVRLLLPQDLKAGGLGIGARDIRLEPL